IYFLYSAAFLLSEIIGRLHAEEKLQIHQKELEKLVEKRTLEYTEANENLLHEIIERRKIEKSLTNNLKFLETLLDTIPAPVYYKDNDGRYLGCNNILARQVLGLEKEEIIGKNFAEAHNKSPAGISLEIHEDDLELLQKGGSDVSEKEIMCADGIKRDFLASRVTFLDEEKNARNMVAVLLDITELRKTENKLQNNVRFLETLLDSIPSPVFQRDLNEIYINCNESFARQIMGLPKAEVIGGSFREFQKRVPKELAEIYHKHDRSLLEKGGSNYYETKVLCADGIERDFLFHKATYQDSSGDVAGVVGVMLDITERKEAEETFRRSEERYRIATEQTGQIVYDYNTKTQEVDWAGAIPELTGYSFEEFQKINPEMWLEHIHPDDLGEIIEKVRVFFEKGERLREEFRFRRKDGNYIYVEDRRVLLRDAEGNPYRVLGVMKDITEIKLASKKMKESEERYRSFMKNFRGIAFQGNLDFTPIMIDGSVEEITEYRGEDFMSGKVNWLQIVLPEDRQNLINNNERLIKYPLLVIEHEYRIRHRDGNIKWVREIIQNVSDFTGKRRILQGAVYDITGQKEAEESLKKVEEIRKKEIHHRIKNNLQVISSLLELQAERFDEKEVLEAFRESQNRVATMAIIHEELYRSKNSETLDFSEYLQKLTSDLFHSYIVRKGDIRMELDIEEIFLGMDTAVPLGIIINELVSNSLKHAFPQGRKGEIRIKLCRVEENGENKSISNSTNNIGAKSSVDKSNQYSLVVSDNGLGFPEKLDFRNTGSLGLQLVNILVEQLEGTIELQNGAGTTFKILFKEND
ncbi:MAG: PAS domain S-box protein, partial [Methanosarcina flavescens]